MDKRERGCNFTEADKELLTTVVARHLAVVESRKTDAVTVRQKNEAWEKIAQDFNALTVNSTRTGQQLKNAYHNLKKKKKKDSADDKVELYKTGGGAYSPKLSDHQTKLLDMLQPQMDPVKSRFDSSRNYIIEDQAQTSSDVDNTEDVGSSVGDEEITVIYEEPPQVEQTTPHSNTKSRKRTINDVYKSVELYTTSKKQKSTNVDRKLQLELEILEVKKKVQEEILKQEIIKTEMLMLEKSMLEKKTKT